MKKLLNDAKKYEIKKVANRTNDKAMTLFVTTKPNPQKISSVF